MAATTDLITQATNGSRPTPTKLTALKSVGAGSITVGTLVGWPTASAVHFIIYNIDTNGNKVAGSQTDWKGIVSGLSITNLVLKAGTDSGYSIGAVVEAAPTAAWADDLYSWGTQDHDVQGRHTNLTDSNGKRVLSLGATASAVNDVIVSNAATGTNPSIAAEGTDSDVSLALSGKNNGRVLVDGLKVTPVLTAGLSNFVISGGVVTFSGTGISITACTAFVNGVYVSAAAVVASTRTLSRDTYVDLKTDGTYAYVEVTNNASVGMTLTANSMRIAKVVTSGSAVVQVLQATFNFAPVTPNTTNWLGFDPIGNPVYNLSPIQTTLGRGVNTTSFNTTNTTTAQAVTGMSVPAIVPTNGTIEIDIFAIVYNTTNGTGSTITLWDGPVATGTLLASAPIAEPTGTQTAVGALRLDLTPSAGLHTYNVGFQAQSTGTSFIQSSAAEQATITIKRV